MKANNRLLYRAKHEVLVAVPSSASIDNSFRTETRDAANSVFAALNSRRNIRTYEWFNSDRISLAVKPLRRKYTPIPHIVVCQTITVLGSQF